MKKHACNKSQNSYIHPQFIEVCRANLFNLLFNYLYDMLSSLKILVEDVRYL
jgi:hypothetical protein